MPEFLLRLVRLVWLFARGQHLRKLLKEYFVYYHRSRTHLALAKDAPESRPVMSQGKIIAIPQVGGLHRRYERRAA